jgi:copper chaperone CopZ
MENNKINDLIEKLDGIQYARIEFNEKNVKSEIYQIANETVVVDDLLSLACAVSMLPFSEEDEGLEIARNIADLAIEIAVKDKNIANLEKIADELENSLEIDDLAEEVREIITSMS